MQRAKLLRDLRATKRPIWKRLACTFLSIELLLNPHAAAIYKLWDARYSVLDHDEYFDK
jgi:hypothetical protein